MKCWDSKLVKYKNVAKYLHLLALMKFLGLYLSLLTPFGYVEKQKHYLFSDDILSYSFSNTIQGYNENWNSYMAKVEGLFWKVAF